MEQIKLTTLWIGWCFLHSYLIAPSVTRYLKKHLGQKYHYYRLFYNFIAIITLILVWRFNPIIEDNILFSWEGYWRMIQLPVFVLSVSLFISGARQYDMLRFLGLRQLAQKRSVGGLTESGQLAVTGILRYTRHPWYLGGILIIWTGLSELTVSKLIMNLVWTAYFIIGAILEERKLVAEFGDEYRRYQQEVSILLPVKSFRS